MYWLSPHSPSPPTRAKPDPALLYYAGYLRTVDGSNNPASFVQGGEYLSKALDMGYADEEGNIYYYLFHCYYGQKAQDKGFPREGQAGPADGYREVPRRTTASSTVWCRLYTSPEDNVGDPADLIGLIDKAIENNPSSVDLWFGRGRIFYALKDYDQSIDSFKKVVELKPDLYEGNYYLGVFYTIKGDEVNKEINAKQYSSQAAYDADLEKVNVIYMEAIPYLEKALELKENDPRLAGAAQVDLLPSARRGGHDGQVQQVQRTLQAGAGRGVIPCSASGDRPRRLPAFGGRRFRSGGTDEAGTRREGQAFLRRGPSLWRGWRSDGGS